MQPSGRFPDDPTPEHRAEYARRLTAEGVPYLHYRESLRRAEPPQEVRPPEREDRT